MIDKFHHNAIPLAYLIPGRNPLINLLRSKLSFTFIPSTKAFGAFRPREAVYVSGTDIESKACL